MTWRWQLRLSLCDASDRTIWCSARAACSRLLVSGRFATRLRGASASTPPRVFLPSAIPPKRGQDCMGSDENYRWSGWLLTFRRVTHDHERHHAGTLSAAVPIRRTPGSRTGRASHKPTGHACSNRSYQRRCSRRNRAPRRDPPRRQCCRSRPEQRLLEGDVGNHVAAVLPSRDRSILLIN